MTTRQRLFVAVLVVIGLGTIMSYRDEVATLRRRVSAVEAERDRFAAATSKIRDPGLSAVRAFPIPFHGGHAVVTLLLVTSTRAPDGLLWITMSARRAQPNGEYRLDAGECGGAAQGSWFNPVADARGTIQSATDNLHVDTSKRFWLRLRGPDGTDFGGVVGPFFSGAARVTPANVDPCA